MCRGWPSRRPAGSSRCQTGDARSLNDVYLRQGRWVNPERPTRCWRARCSARRTASRPGDQVAAIINGRRRRLTIVGVALSPEYVYAIRPGEMIPDARRFGVFWMSRRALASAFNMEGGFNDVSIALARGVAASAVIDPLDRLLEPYGGFGAIPQSLQLSAWTLENELTQLQTFGFITPLIFLGVAAFILNVALTRALSLQRPQIAALKALGYSNRELAWHYIKWALIIAAVGAIAGVAGRRVARWGMIELYNEFFRFPMLDYRLSMGVAVASVVGSLVVAALGAQSAVRRAVRVPPAEAMRPSRRPDIAEHLRAALAAAPADADDPHDSAQPRASAGPVADVGHRHRVRGCGAVGRLLVLDVMDALIDRQFGMAMRQDATLTFVEPRSARAAVRRASISPASWTSSRCGPSRFDCAPVTDRGRWPSPACPARRA